MDPAHIIESLTYAYAGWLSPEGDRVAWIRNQVLGDDDQFEVIVKELESGTEVSVGPARDARWSPDGTTLAFVWEDKSGLAQAFAWDAHTHQATQVTALAQGIAGGLAWTSDSRSIAFAVPPQARDRSLPYRVTRIVGWRDQMGLVDDAATDLWLHDFATDQTRQLTDDDWVNGSPVWVPETGEFAYLATSPPDRWENLHVVRAVRVRDGTVRDILHTDDITALVGAPAQIGGLVMSAGGVYRDAPGEVRLLRLDGTDESRTVDLGIDVMGTLIGDLPVPYADLAARILLHGTDAIVPVQIEDRLEIHRVALTGPLTSTVELATTGCVYPLDVAGDLLLYGAGDLLSPPDLWVRNLATGETRQITDTLALNRPRLRPVSVERAWVHAPDGPAVQVKFLRPSDSEGALPTVLIVHGGPYAAFGECFVTDAQLLCEAGFGVLLVNPRGSRGYGVAFGKAIDGDWGNVDFADLMAAVDHAVDVGWTDPDRLGVTGLSYGGYMTAWIVANTHRFHAAVYENGVTNLVSMYGTSDIGLSYLPEAFGAEPTEAMETYVRCSPITTAHTAVTPTLVIIGEADHRCPPEQGLQFYSVLRRADCDAELLILPGASHAGSIFGSIAVRRAKNEALLEWMRRYV